MKYKRRSDETTIGSVLSQVKNLSCIIFIMKLSTAKAIQTPINTLRILNNEIKKGFHRVYRPDSVAQFCLRNQMIIFVRRNEILVSPQIHHQ